MPLYELSDNGKDVVSTRTFKQFPFLFSVSFMPIPNKLYILKLLPGALEIDYKSKKLIGFGTDKFLFPFAFHPFEQQQRFLFYLLPGEPADPAFPVLL